MSYGYLCQIKIKLINTHTHQLLYYTEFSDPLFMEALPFIRDLRVIANIVIRMDPWDANKFYQYLVDDILDLAVHWFFQSRAANY